MILSLPWWERVRERGKFTLTQTLSLRGRGFYMESEGPGSSPCHAKQSRSERGDKLRLDFWLISQHTEIGKGGVVAGKRDLKLSLEVVLV
jgi:hypothetical protein